MNSTDIRFPGFDARAERGSIRWELFLDWDVRDVLMTPQADTLKVIHRADPDRTGWAAALKAAGFPEPTIGGSVPEVEPGPIAA